MSRLIEDKWIHVLHAIDTGHVTIDEIAKNLGFGRSTISRTLRSLVEDGRVEVIDSRQRPFKYREIRHIPPVNNGPSPAKTDRISKSPVNDVLAPDVDPTQDVPETCDTIESARKSLDWLFDHVKRLEAENRSLYAALCSYGARSDDVRKRYEDRLDAIIRTQKEVL